MKFSDRAMAISPFLAMAYGEKAASLERKGHHVVRLNLGEPDFGAPKPVIDAMQHAVAQGNLPYTSALGIGALREKIAQFYKTKHEVELSPNRIVVTAGASAALLLVSAALVNEGDKVLIGDPSYPCNRRFISSFGGDVTLVPTDASSQFQVSQQSLQQHWEDSVKGVVIASPANPTGTSVPEQELKAISRWCEQNNAWRVIDEIYLDLNLSDDESARSVLAFDNNAIVINSFSKYFGMTGWRLGWCVVPEAMVEVIEKLAQNLFICASTPAQIAALACFEDESLAEAEQRRDILKQRKNKVLEALGNTLLSVDVKPNGAFYVYINVSRTGLSAIEFCDKVLNEAHVALTPGNDFGETNADNYVRLSFATSDEELDLGLERLVAFVNKLNE